MAGPSRTGKAKRKQAHFLKLKLKDMAASGKITAEDFEMEDAPENAAPEAAAPAKKAAKKKGGRKKKATGGDNTAVDMME